MTPETQLKNSVDRYLKSVRLEQGCKFWFQKISDRFTKGIPDYVLCVYGKFAAMELKAPGAAHSSSETLQNHNCTQIRRAGGEARQCRNLKEVQEFVESLLKP